MIGKETEKFLARLRTQCNSKQSKIERIQAIISGNYKIVQFDKTNENKPFLEAQTNERYSYRELEKLRRDGQDVYFQDEETALKYVEQLEKLI